MQFDATPRAPVSATLGGLPETLLRTPSAAVHHGSDPGNFYCEHAFFVALNAANAPGSSIVVNANGERLVGFLHVPHDQYTYSPRPLADPTTVADQAARHRGTREVIGVAIRGYVDAARRSGAHPVRLLLTGFGAWAGVYDNPTGDFVSHRANIDAAMRHAWGRNLVAPEGRRIGGDEQSDIWSYRVRDPSTGRQDEVRVEARRLPVSDEAIDGSDGSLQAAIERFRPHGVISMGVHGGPFHLAEHHADDGGLRIDERGRPGHDGGVAPTRDLPANYALPRALP